MHFSIPESLWPPKQRKKLPNQMTLTLSIECCNVTFIKRLRLHTYELEQVIAAFLWWRSRRKLRKKRPGERFLGGNRALLEVTFGAKQRSQGSLRALWRGGEQTECNDLIAWETASKKMSRFWRKKCKYQRENAIQSWIFVQFFCTWFNRNIGKLVQIVWENWRK